MYREPERAFHAWVGVQEVTLRTVVERHGGWLVALIAASLVWMLGARLTAPLVILPFVSLWARRPKPAAPDRGADTRIVVRPRQIEIRGRTLAVRHARFDGESVIFEGPRLSPSVYARLTPEDAADAVEALGVTDWGVRTLHVVGPVRSLVTGAVEVGLWTALMALSIVATLALVGGRTNAEAVPVFVGVLGGAATWLALMTAPRRVELHATGIDVGWLGLRLKIAWSSVPVIAFEGWTLVLGSARHGLVLGDSTPSAHWRERHRVLAVATQRWLATASVWRARASILDAIPD